MTDTPRTVVIGFDALSERYLDAFADDLPNFESLRSAGVDAPLESTFPPWTGSAWPSMYTGTNPGQHGAYSFFDFGDAYPDEATVVSRTDVRSPAIWNYLSALDRSSVVLNVPVTHPAEPIEGVLVPGYLAPEDAHGHPPDVRSELDSAVGDYRIYAEGELSSDSDRKLDGYVEAIETRARGAAWLLETHDWEFAFVQVQKTDTVFHTFDDPEAHRRVYRAADEFLGEIMAAVGEDTNVIVCSDHGIGPFSGYKIYLNEILREQGYVEASTDSTSASLSNRKSELVAGYGSADDAESGGGSRALVATATSALEAVGVTPGDAYSVAQRLGFGDLITRLVGPSMREAVRKDVDWAASKAYCRNAAECGIRINLAGREPDGVVDPSEYEAVRTELIELLTSIRTPDGEPAFESVARREEVFDGPRVEDAPDVVFLPKDMNHLVVIGLLGTKFVPVEGHDHKRDGVLIASGPDVNGDATIDRRSLLDVAPTAMALLGLGVPERMEGTVPDGLLSVPVESETYSDVPFGTDRDSRTGETVEDRLADLGYVE